MYNYNRIGPWPIYNVDETAWNPSAMTFDAEDGNVYPKIRTVTEVDLAGSVHGYVTQDLGSLQQVAFGIAVNGRLENNVPMQFGFAGSAEQIGIMSIAPRPFVARLDDGVTLVNTLGSGVNQCSNPMYLPVETDIVFSESTHVSRVTWNTSVIIGEVGSYDQDNTRTLIFGVSYKNTQAAADGGEMEFTMSVHRGLRPIDTYDIQR